MTTYIQRVGMVLAVSALALGLQACGTATVSKNISDDGVAGEVIFPDRERSAWLKEGTFPNLANLRQIAPGVTKDQLYGLVGRPHFEEGLAGVREWDYVFHFRTPTGVKTCQYKAIFDTKGLAQTFHWLPADCADLLNRAEPAARVSERVVDKPVSPRRIVLSADALFAFDRSGAADILPKGRQELAALAAELRKAPNVDRLDFVGHTDRLGSSAYNQQLSLARATTVRDYLVRAGVLARAIEVKGRGESDPKVNCEQHEHEHAVLVACLAPNRRVEISVQATAP